MSVVPRVGAWIETSDISICIFSLQRSYPVWVRGLKLHTELKDKSAYLVVPRVGAWIETFIRIQPHLMRKVVPRVGAWIETPNIVKRRRSRTSYPVWVRGLKQSHIYILIVDDQSRTPCGCVD